ncbi:cell wall hydrolase [Tissierella creatinophila]|uniref:Spore cortex-lytic enzyme n=1 Tax=Tissierella creatinophila DSM 6911 TaxID=1123403 RepID=A0A1U7M340_TISCR|nr:cell wall hydrolase [Tissierella creatinophila]OLS01629.1 spore cortex-lytic enzyme precursor [Tissierella creatinophila DSM 6911]
MFINKNNKFLIIILLSILFTLTKNTNVLADSQLQININEQGDFLEEKRLSQSKTLKEKQRSATVEGMLSFKEIEDRKKAEKEKKIKKEQNQEEDTYSEIVKSIRKMQSKKQGAKQTATKKSRSNTYYKNTNIPIIKQKTNKQERITLSKTVSNIIPEGMESKQSEQLLGKNVLIKDLDKPVPNREAMDMNFPDINMFERIVMAESGGEPYLGQVAVANVILNRIRSDKYPSTLEGVIFQKSQFSPVKNGIIRGRIPTQSVKRAVAEALNGKMVVPEDTLYFVNPILATDQTIPRTKTPVKVIGSHVFYK